MPVLRKASRLGVMPCGMPGKLARRLRSAGYARPPLGVPADLQSAVKKCPNLFMLWGFVIPSNQAVASQYWTA